MPENNNNRGEVFSKRVPAGKRTYFFDVKETRSNDYYVVISESKRRTGDDGNPFYVKQKIFLYPEDFDKFLDGLPESFNTVVDLLENAPHRPQTSQASDEEESLETEKPRDEEK